MKFLTFSFSIFMAVSIAKTQDLGIHFGHQIFGVMNAKNPINGISIGLDIPRTGFITPYGQVTLFQPQSYTQGNIGILEPMNPMDPYIYNVSGRARTNSIAAEFGTIYYLGGAYDYGFSVMLHNSVRLMFLPTKVSLDGVENIDLTKYRFAPTNSFFNYPGTNGFALSTTFGLGGKYSFDWGSIYAMAGLELVLFGDKFPQYYYGEQSYISPFAFSTRIGIRRDLDFSGKSKKENAKPDSDSTPKERKPSRRELRRNL